MGGESISINLFKNINKILVLFGKFDKCWFWLGVVSCVIAPKTMVLPSITSIETRVDFLTTWSCVGWQMFGQWKKRWRRSPPMLTLVVCFLEYEWCPHTEWNWDWDQQQNMSLCKGGVGWDLVARSPTMTRCSCFPTLGAFPQLVLEVWQAFEGTGELCALGYNSKDTGCLSFSEVSWLLSKD
jgi:hypothetical protein